MIATGSQLWLLLICAGSVVLPTIQRASAAARAGTAAHREEIEPWLRGEPPITELGRRLREVPLPTGLRAEVAFAVDVTGAGPARWLHDNGARDYSDVGADEFCLTLDGAGPGNSLELKTGRVRVDPVRRNPQVLLGALAVWWHWGELPTALLVQAGTGLYPERVQLTARELVAFQRQLQRLRATVLELRTGADSDLVVGTHCRYCPALHSCPAVAEVTSDDPGVAYGHAVALKAKAEQQIRAVELLAADAPVPLARGRELKSKTRMVRRYDARRTAAALTEHFSGWIAQHLETSEYRAGVLDAWAAEQTLLGDTRRARISQLNKLLADAGALTFDGQEYMEVADAKT